MLQWACSGEEQNNERVKTSNARFPQIHPGAYTYELGGLFWDIITFSFEVLRRDRLDPVCDSALDPDMFKTFFIWLLYLVDDTSNRCT